MALTALMFQSRTGLAGSGCGHGRGRIEPDRPDKRKDRQAGKPAACPETIIKSVQFVPSVPGSRACGRVGGRGDSVPSTCMASCWPRSVQTSPQARHASVAAHTKEARIHDRGSTARSWISTNLEHTRPRPRIRRRRARERCRSRRSWSTPSPGVGPKLHRHPYTEVFVVESKAGRHSRSAKRPSWSRAGTWS